MINPYITQFIFLLNRSGYRTLIIKEIMSSISFETFQQDFRPQKYLGRGACSTVTQVLNLKEKKCYALKSTQIQSAQNLSYAFNQIEVTNALCEPTTLKFHHYYIRRMASSEMHFEMGVVMDLCGDCLADIISKRKEEQKPFSPDEIHHFIRSFMKLFVKMQARGYVHRDIKPANIMRAIGEANTYKLVDFGYAVKISQYSRSTVAGTLEYVSPKLMHKFIDKDLIVPGNNHKDDVYSFGKTILEMLTFNTNLKLEANVRRGILLKYGDSVLHLLSMMLTEQEVDRPDFFKLEETMAGMANFSSIDEIAQNSEIMRTKKKKGRNEVKVSESSSQTIHSGSVDINNFSQKPYQHYLSMKSKEPINSMLLLEDMLIIGMQGSLGIYHHQSHFGKMKLFNDKKAINILQVDKAKQLLYVSSLNCRIKIIKVIALKSATQLNSEDFSQIVIPKSVSCLDIYDSTVIFGHYSGEVSILNDPCSLTSFQNQLISSIKIADNYIYTSSNNGTFRRRAAPQFGLSFHPQGLKYLSDSYKCESPIIGFELVKKWLAMLVTIEGFIHLVTHSMRCERMVRFSSSPVLGFSRLEEDIMAVNVNGELMDSSGNILLNIEMKGLHVVCVGSQQIYCGSYDGKVAVLARK